MTVTVYSKPACGKCMATTRTLDSKGIKYEYVDIYQNPEGHEAAKALGYLEAPVVVAGDDHWSGFRPDKIDALAEALKAA